MEDDDIVYQLGELNSDQLFEISMNPVTRSLERMVIHEEADEPTYTRSIATFMSAKDKEFIKERKNHVIQYNIDNIV